jgi:hypothetical protein
MRGQPFPGMVAWVGEPGDFAHLGEQRDRARRGLPNAVPPYDEMPRDYWDPDARVERLDKWGVDEAVVFPQWGFMWEFLLADDLETRINCAAWNRWAVKVAAAGRGDLHPVGHVSYLEATRRSSAASFGCPSSTRGVVLLREGRGRWDGAFLSSREGARDVGLSFPGELEVA